jgi:hypothetical protein
MSNNAEQEGGSMHGGPVSQSTLNKVISLFVSRTEKLPLRAGELVSVEVLSAGPNNAATVRLKNIVVDVQTDVPLQKGETLTLRVERQENAIYLRLGGDVPGKQAESVKGTLLSTLTTFEGLNPGSEALVRLTDLLSKLPESLKQNLPEIEIIRGFLLQIDDLSGKTVKDMVQNGGIFLETKLRILALGLDSDGADTAIEAGRIISKDLKASLLRLKDTLLVPAVLEHLRTSVSPDDLLGALNAVLRNIEFYQLQSKLTDSLQFFLPLVWKQLKDGEIIVQEYDQGKPGERSYSCTINLVLRQVGKISVLVVYQAGAVHVTCTVEDECFSKLFQEDADVLDTQFRSSGLRLGRCSVYHEPRLEFKRNSSEEGFSIKV